MPRSLRLALACSVLVGCGVPATDGATNGSGPDGFDTECARWSYDGTPEAWPLPTGLPAGALARTTRAKGDCDADLPAFATFDLTGDGLPDLVAFTDCADATVGQTRWRVWPGEAAGFGAEIGWALPAGYAEDSFGTRERLAPACDDADDVPAFFLAALAGAAGMDLVVTRTCADATDAADAWRVYPNTGAGFGPEQARALPTGFSGASFVAPRDAPICDDVTSAPAWGLDDLDGGRRVDLVVTRTCVDTDIGYRRWDRYDNDGTAFAATPEAWAIPPILAAGSLDRATGDCASGRPGYFRLDRTVGGPPSLVVPEDCSWQDGVWAAFAPLGDGFAPDALALRAPWGLDRAITGPSADTAACDRSLPAWNLDDADGDGETDLTVTASCVDPAVGQTRWALYPGGADGWGDPVPVLLPTTYPAGAFAGDHGDGGGCGGTANRPAWARLDLDDDGIPELVVTSSCDDPAVGVTTWRVHRATCVEEVTSFD
jgi:hypothetical protein